MQGEVKERKWEGTESVQKVEELLNGKIGRKEMVVDGLKLVRE